MTKLIRMWQPTIEDSGGKKPSHKSDAHRARRTFRAAGLDVAEMIRLGLADTHSGFPAGKSASVVVDLS